MKIQRAMIISFVENVSQLFSDYEDRVAETTCPHCRKIIRYPIVAREEDIAIIEKLIDFINQYMEEHGILEDVLEEIHKRCIDAIEEKKKLIV